ncbi:universal stress protein [Halohasta salina]|uniref:universal stress protein n=1 Tax=Halohasta salina TaxID=2961621 RepID=UPI0020A3BD8C|nr:universal stress protein [Halohasta salina]
MTDRVLVPVDDSPLAADALDYVFNRRPEAAVTALHVSDPTLGMNRLIAGGGFDDWYDDACRETAELFESAHGIAEAHGREIETTHEIGDPGRTVCEYAAANPIDEIVMGSHGRHGTVRFLLGSVAEHVVRHAPVPVTVVK